MAYEVDFKDVSTIGLESSPVAAALAGLRANEARYFRNKYDQAFVVEPAKKAKKLVDYVHRILEEERDIIIESRPLEAAELHVDGIRWTFVFYESGLAINVLYTLDDEKKRAVGFKLSDGMEVPEELASRFKFAKQKSKLAGTIRGSFFVIKGEYGNSEAGMAVRKATAEETTSRKTSAKQSAARKAPAKAAAAKKAPANDGGAKKTSARANLQRADLGAPVDDFFARQPPEQRVLLEALHAMIEKAAPDARASIKWGMPYYELKRGFCALYTAPSYVGLNLMAPPEKFDDPEGKLEGTGKTMRHLKVRSAADLDEGSILRWLKTAAAHHS